MIPPKTFFSIPQRTETKKTPGKGRVQNFYIFLNHQPTVTVVGRPPIFKPRTALMAVNFSFTRAVMAYC
jgi:hypothetical protein